MNTFSPIDLSQVPIPAILEQLDYENILTETADFVTALDPDLADALALESEPSRKVLRACAYREMLIRQRINDAARALTLVYAMGDDLENLAANYNVERNAGESDDSLRRRAQLAFEGLATAGPTGSYLFHALKPVREWTDVDGDWSERVRDASVVSPTPGIVDVTILSAGAENLTDSELTPASDGTPSAELVALVDAALSADDVRPLTDQVNVQGATITDYTIEAALTLYPGADSGIVLSAAQEAAAAFALEHHKLGHDITLTAIHAALHVEGVQEVTLTQPAARLEIDDNAAAHCSAITITEAGQDT